MDEKHNGKRIMKTTRTFGICIIRGSRSRLKSIRVDKEEEWDEDNENDEGLWDLYY